MPSPPAHRKNQDDRDANGGVEEVGPLDPVADLRRGRLAGLDEVAVFHDLQADAEAAVGAAVAAHHLVEKPARALGHLRLADDERLSDQQALAVNDPHARARIIDVQVVDYSRTGVGIIHSESLLVGQTFVVREPQVTKGSSRFLYKVVRCDRRPDSRFSIGLQVVENGDFIEPSEPPAPKISSWVQWAYFLYAAIGVAIVLILSMRWR